MVPIVRNAIPFIVVLFIAMVMVAFIPAISMGLLALL